MADPAKADLASPRTSAADQQVSSDSKLKVARARSGISDDTEDEDGPPSPHFYSMSVRQDSPSYHANSVNSASNNLDDYDIDGSIREDTASEQQVDDKAVKLDLLRRQHSLQARHTLEQLQTAASTASQRSNSPTRRSSTEIRRTSSGVSMEIVRQQSEQLKQASGDLKRLAEEQRTLAEEAVANFLLKEDVMMTGGQDKSAGSPSNDAGLSQALSAVFEEQQGTSRNSLTKQMEKIRRSEQAIKDAEADERIADQLAALQLTLSQLADQEEVGSTAEHGGDIGDSNKGSAHMQALQPGRALLKDISENSQEGLDSSQGRSSSPGQSQGQSHMAASAFAAVNQINGFQEDDQLDQDDQGKDHLDQASPGKDQDESAGQIRLGAAELAQAKQQTAQHEQHQAQSPDGGSNHGSETSQTGSKSPQSGAKSFQTDTAAGPQGAKASDAQSTPLTESSLKALRVNTDASQSEAPAVPTAVPGPDQSLTPQSPAQAASQGSDLAGSTPGSHTFDSELHDGIAALVQAPGITDKADHQQPSDPIISSELDAAIMGVGDLTSAASIPDSASSQLGAEAAQAAAADADRPQIYSLGSDEEEDLTVVSSEDQAREAQAAASQFMESSSRPTTPDIDGDQPPQDQPLQEPPSMNPPATPSDRQLPQQDESASESAAGVSAYATSQYDRHTHMVNAFEPEEFRGMLFHDGVDSQGRPVIVVNTDAVGTTRRARAQALQYMLHRLEPIVVQGPYVLVMVATGQHQKSNKLPAMWLISAYRNLSRPFRKNVRYILLVRPTGGLKTLVACVRPFVSAKAARKVKKVDSLAAIAAATSNEVTLQHLGSRFAAAAGNYFLEGKYKQSATADPYDMPHF